MRELHVILRTSMDNSVRPWKRIIDVPRDTLVLTCVDSLIESINNFKEPDHLSINLSVLDDNSSAENLKKLEKVLNKLTYPCELIPLKKQGVNHSALEQFKFGHDSKDMVYMVEDDYFHHKHAIEIMFNAFFYFRQFTDLNDVAIYPYDSTHLYEPENNYKPEPTKVYQLNNWYWRTTTKTANTVLLNNITMKKFWFLFEKLALEFPYIAEDHTINRMYNNNVDVGGPVTLFSPMPSLAVHVSYNMPMIMDSSFINWVGLFNERALLQNI